jgi:hypothetical protein
MGFFCTVLRRFVAQYFLLVLTKTRLLRAGDVQFYKFCDGLSGLLIYVMVVCSPWAFGTTESIAIGGMNAAGYILGALLVGKLFLRRWKRYRPARWEMLAEPLEQRQPRFPFTALLAAETVLILLFCLVSAINAKATYSPLTISFIDHQAVEWLPHSFDSIRSWQAFWNYLALACSFWAVRDWLLGKAGDEEWTAAARVAGGSGQKVETSGQRQSDGKGKSKPLLPARLRRLLWVLAINGGLLAVEGIVQRLEGSGRLLFLIKPRINTDAVAQFGPYAYRANAAAYFNLVWPVCLGLWWMQHLARGFRRHSHHLILVCTAIMAACPIISTSRGGAIVTVGILVLATVFLLTAAFIFKAHRQETKKTRRNLFVLLLLFFAGALTLGYSLGWKALAPRMEELREGFMNREEMYDNAQKMAADYPLFGTGPGTFGTVFQLYQITLDTFWPEQLHNDWLETRITFGRLGSGLIGLALLTVLLRWFGRGGIHGGRRFVVLVWLALAGCMVHARWDFPFQIYSILFLFLVLCAVLFVLSRRP